MNNLQMEVLEKVTAPTNISIPVIIYAIGPIAGVYIGEALRSSLNG